MTKKRPFLRVKWLNNINDKAFVYKKRDFVDVALKKIWRFQIFAVYLQRQKVNRLFYCLGFAVIASPK
jgi:hypothetical protein